MENRPTVILFGTEIHQKHFLIKNTPFVNQTGLQLIIQETLISEPILKSLISVYHPNIILLADSIRHRLNYDIPIPTYRYSIPKDAVIGFHKWSHLAFNAYYYYVEELYNSTIRQGNYGAFLYHRELARLQKPSLVQKFIIFRFVDFKIQIIMYNYVQFNEMVKNLQRFPLQRPPTECPEILCGPGYRYIYGNISDGFSWKCERCAANYFKKDYGNTDCLPCSGALSIDNGKRTECVDPFKEKFLQYKTVRIVVLAMSGTGALMTLLIMIVFTLKRDTPMVRLSDYMVSIGHMALSIFIFASIMVALVLRKTSLEICMVKVLLISVCYVISIGILFIKSQKILQAFLSNVRLTQGEAKRTIAVQIFILVIFLLFVNGGLLVAIFQHPINVLELRFSSTLTKLQVCNTSLHTSVVIGLTMVIQSLCSIQAFRGRNLPSVMNDGIILTYATFTLSVVSGTSFAIVYFQKQEDKEVFQLGTVAVNSLVISFLLYGQKAIRMLLHPDRNTKTFFQQQRMTPMR